MSPQDTSIVSSALEALGRIPDELVEVLRCGDTMYLLYDDKTYSIVEIHYTSKENYQ